MLLNLSQQMFMIRIDVSNIVSKLAASDVFQVFNIHEFRRSQHIFLGLFRILQSHNACLHILLILTPKVIPPDPLQGGVEKHTPFWDRDAFQNLTWEDSVDEDDVVVCSIDEIHNRDVDMFTN